MDDDDEEEADRAWLEARDRDSKSMKEKVREIFRVFGENRAEALCTGLCNETAFVIKTR